MLQIVASLTDDTKGVIYDHNVYSTGNQVEIEKSPQKTD
jgi:hypothetical protein